LVRGFEAESLAVTRFGVDKKNGVPVGRQSWRSGLGLRQNSRAKDQLREEACMMPSFFITCMEKQTSILEPILSRHFNNPLNGNSLD